jgi:cyclopropane-fatty-acyl-phospholipid synthase
MSWLCSFAAVGYRSTVPKRLALRAGLDFGPGAGSNSAVTLDGAIDRLGPRALRAMLRRLGEPPIRFELFGEQRIGGGEAPIATVRVADRRALAKLLLDPDFQFGELFVAGRIEVDGDLLGALRLAFSVPRPAGFAGRAFDALWRRLPHDRHSAMHHAQHHYEVGNEFYQLWLDQRMVYTCAYFPSPEDGLEEAQLAKLDHVCRKLALQPGERVIEAGCGWGALALHMARYYGVRVRAFNVAGAQLELARELAEKEGLADRVEFVLDDYRNIAGRCDAFVSVGMLEHVGRKWYPELGAVVGRVLEPGGRGLIHSIGRSQERRLSRWTERRVFPGAHPPTLREMMAIFEPNALAVLDVENLRRHYALTARHWLQRFQASRPRIDALVGPERARTWELYLAGTVASFEASTIELFQVLFNRVGSDALPWTRAHVYTGEPARFGAAGGAAGPL